MTEKQILFLALGDLSIVPQIETLLHGTDFTILASDDTIPPLPGNAQYWCFVDWLLPNISGIEICRQLRETAVTRDAHITMLLDDDDSETKKRALKCGADDYLVGNADPSRLAARLQQYRKADPVPTIAIAQNGDIQVDLKAYTARYQGRTVNLAPNEFQLLAHFVQNPDKVFSRCSLIALLGKHDAHIDVRTVDVWIGRLRRALRAQNIPDRLRTVRSMGYVFDGADP